MIYPVAPNELLTRYIISSHWFRKQDQTVKQDAFIPPDDSLELSVTRHLNLTEDDIWSIGRGIVRVTPRTLHGRADVETGHVIAQRLSMVPQPAPDNPNHANIVGWPLEKDARKLCALEIARVARFVANPEVRSQIL